MSWANYVRIMEAERDLTLNIKTIAYGRAILDAMASNPVRQDLLDWVLWSGVLGLALSNYARIDDETLKKMSDINAIATNEIAMDALTENTMATGVIIAMGEEALGPIIASGVAMGSVTKSNVAMGQFASNKTAMDLIAASEMAVNMIAKSIMAMNTVTSSSVAVNAMVNRSLPYTTSNARFSYDSGTNALIKIELTEEGRSNSGSISWAQALDFTNMNRLNIYISAKTDAAFSFYMEAVIKIGGETVLELGGDNEEFIERTLDVSSLTGYQTLTLGYSSGRSSKKGDGVRFGRFYLE